MIAPPPPPPPGGAPPPPAPPGGVQAPVVPQHMLVDPNRFKIVTGLGEALHKAKLKICGEKETPACAEGVSSGMERPVKRPQSWHGGKPQRNRAIIDEMQNKLAARRAKVDKESEPVPAPNIGKPPRPASYAEGRKISAPAGPPSRGYTPPVDYGPSRGRTPSDFGAEWTPVLNRKFSQDSGVQSREHSWTPPATRSQYRRVSVDMERKEELMLAKQVRSSSVKILRMSPAPDSDALIAQKKEERFDVPNSSVPPPSAVVLRYWNQCTDGTPSTNEDQTKDEESNLAPSWKDDALEGEVKEFPSIKDKINRMEEGTMVTSVPDVKRKLDLGEFKPAGWMETRKKLQTQLDVLLNKTSAKMTTIAKKDVDQKDDPEEKTEKTEDAQNEPTQKKHYPEVDSHVKSLIKSVANEIQKSFSQRNLDLEEEDDHEEEEENKVKEEEKPTDNADIDKTETYIESFVPEEPSLEAPIDFDSIPIVLDTSINREKMQIVRKSSRERRLPASIIAKKRAAEKLKEIITSKVSTGDTDAEMINGPLKELISPDTKSDEEKVDVLAKEMCKLESSQVLQILQTVEKGILDFSIPLLIPFLSIQVKLSMSKNIYKDLNKENKTEVMKESIIDSLINDITDIAILQEVIERSQEKLNSLQEYERFKESSTQVEFQEKKDASTLTELETVEEVVEIEEPKKSSEATKAITSSDIEVKEDTKISNFNKSNETNLEESPKDVVEPERTEINDNVDKEEKTDEIEKSEDSGVDSEESNTDEKLSKSKSEKDIKKAIMNILNDAKKQENTRAVRNFGRTFEFQQTQLKPVIPNDRRPMKARKMDNMWNNQIASKSFNFNGMQTTKPTARVPWTMKSNANPVKKDSVIYDKEVEEFEKCRNKLNEIKTTPKQPKSSVSTIVKIQNDEKKSAESGLKDKLQKPTSKEEVKEIKEESPKKEEELITEKKEDNNGKDSVIQAKTNPNVKSVEKKEEEIKIVDVEEAKEDTIEEIDVSTADSVIAESISLKEKPIPVLAKEEEQKETKESSDDGKDIIEIPNNSVRSSSEISSISSDWEGSDTDEEKEQPNSKVEEKKEVIKVEEPELNQANKQSEHAKETEFVNEESKAAPVIMTPMTRRRMEMGNASANIKLPSSGPPPPPPSFRPPPPPASPPAVDIPSKIQKLLDSTTTRFETLQKEFIATEKDKPTTEMPKPQIINKKEESESEEESEWEEWTEEEESEYEEEEEESSVSANKEKWENILSDSGPTTFSAEFSIKLS